MHPIVAAAQYPISFHRSFAAWQEHTTQWVKEAVRQKAQLLVFPEYGAMELVSLLPEAIRADIKQQVRSLQLLEADFCTVFENLARQHQLIIVAPSLPVVVGQQIYNRAYVFGPKGGVAYQEKFFMTRFENEDWGVNSAPKQLNLFETSWGSFGIQICYDMEFPIGAQLLCAAGANLILSPSCTETIRGATRVHVGARARALENQCYTLVSQTINNAEWSPTVDINYGYAACYSSPDKGLPPEGIVAIQPPQTPGWLVTSLDMKALETVRTDGQVFNFKDLQQTLTSLKGEPIQVVRWMI
ncbi:MAG: carbon-nitrogen hydrolase family protein [Spirosomataceae bacterium]